MTTRILLVDDHRLLRESLRSILENDAGLAVIGEAESGREAVRLAREMQPDVVVMDVVMRDLNGIEATRQICAGSAGIKVVALSSHSDRRYVQAILDAGASAYVLKANAYDDLRRAFDAVLHGRKYLCAEVTEGVVDAASSGRRAATVYEILGPREREVLQLLAEGLTSQEIAARMSVAISTVESHRRNLMRKLDLHSVAELTRFAIREGLSPLDAPRNGVP
jgi:two-component system NarL family response regulator